MVRDSNAGAADRIEPMCKRPDEPLRITRELQKLGYEVIREVRRYGFASVHGIRVTEQGLDGGADPNHDGIWMGF